MARGRTTMRGTKPRSHGPGPTTAHGSKPHSHGPGKTVAKGTDPTFGQKSSGGSSTSKQLPGKPYG